jgi:ATP phosphoribosyltransferase regulatory subunit
MTDKPAIRAEGERLMAFLQANGAQVVDTDILQPADILLDLYGEDIRARAYVTHDPDRGEMMLRPDFTVPVVQRHMADGADPARYTYMGEVFRKQDVTSARASEYLQVGYEVFDRTNPAAADAEVFALFSEILSPLPVKPVTGDIGIVMAAVQSLRTTDRRKAALMRHIWRPRRFRALLDRFTGRKPPPAGRAALLQRADAGIDALIAGGGPRIGLRTATEIATRIGHLQQDATVAPIGSDEAAVLGTILGLRETLPNAYENLRDITVDMPGISGAVARMARRIDALDKAGIDVSGLPFEASYGRTTMEYYDGFVFGFLADGRPDLAPVATGGRYDALTRMLGQGREIPAVGGVIRPNLVHELRRSMTGGAP